MLRRGTSSLSNYHRAVFPGQIARAFMMAGSYPGAHVPLQARTNLGIYD